MEIKIRDILFWILILAAVGVAFWLLLGSPTTEQGLLMITIFIASSEILLWKYLFSIDKKTAIGLEKVKHRFDKIDNELKEIKFLVK
jgi:membrane protein implicated in regulation of membrane protease activity